MRVLSVEKVIGASVPEAVFAGVKTAEEARKLFRKLSKQLHPDVCKHPKATDAFDRLHKFLDEVIERIDRGTWTGERNVEYFRTKDGIKLRVRYLAKRPFEMGTRYVTDGSAVWLFDQRFPIACSDFARFVLDDYDSHFKYRDDEMRKEFARYIPSPVGAYELADGTGLIRVIRDPETVCLEDLLEHQGGSIDPKHVAWIMSSLYNLACYLSYTFVAHNGITLNSYFVNPSKHSGQLLGGWQYAVRIGSKMVRVPREVWELAESTQREKKVGLSRLDLLSVRSLGERLLGQNIDKCPKAMRSWVKLPTVTDDAFKEYRAWSECLKSSFGERRFVKFAVSASDVYKEN